MPRVDYREMKEIDLKMSLLKGNPIMVDNIEIVPYTLAEIVDYGYTQYVENIQWLSLTIDDFIKYVDDMDKKGTLMAQKIRLKPFDFLFSFGTEEDKAYTMSALAMVLRTEDIYILSGADKKKLLLLDLMKNDILTFNEYDEPYFDEERFSELDDEDVKVVSRENLENIVEVVKMQNYLMDIKADEEDYNPSDELARQIAERLKETREAVENIKRADSQNEEDGTDIVNIIDSLSAVSNTLNKINIWDYNMFQLYRDLERHQLIDDYHLSIKAMMAGSKNVKIRHWSSKI